ncbi:MAG: 2Fe-2S iron-sulfur cluster-binding protein [Hydrogenophaga sp.]|uniref:2Fe-2S iron-sulfur cluster-binding protein n=1 Tax=Hydrogenophaga sp. TaxID=1904254 RepID=UPI0027713271|nr:2Fe-2S iron-sulfur cluster-binding protein [Hydrogenophaga sp.]MDP2417585.1 2Fe-2S iron-sulfur cluster-binding protein [Hydrogenophaga sp.]MDZ4187795.1 2Fe-2S iron-sulfur cluster-binding protein [Hydrogenophaga sp.]
MSDIYQIHHAQLGTIRVRPLETVLEASLRLGLNVPFSCRGGSCHTCMMQSMGGPVPERAQRGLAQIQKDLGLFLPCVCYPEADMRVAPKGAATQACTTLTTCPSLTPTDTSAIDHHRTEVPSPPQDPALWAELDNGKRVRQVLDAFYVKVFADEWLAPYFHNTTADHVAGKQYAFLYESMTGEDMYFGDNPLNAHHWMVISDALFDHRQRLMIETLEEHGLSDDQIRRWTAFEEPYRPDIVKEQASARHNQGRAGLQQEGFAEEVLAVGSMCDHCGAEIEAGTKVLYHQRLGTLSCAACRQQALHAKQG